MELSGVLIVIKKSIWEKVGGFKEDKMLTIDNDIHRKIRISGGLVGLMKGIYVQHWYRGGIKENRQHLL
jgi:GT2 family glycosyltransferase